MAGVPEGFLIRWGALWNLGGFPAQGAWVDLTGPDPKKCRRHENVRTEILCRMVRSTASQLSWGLFSLPFLCLCHGPQKLTPIPKNVFATKLLAPKFCAECTDQQLHSSHGDYFRCHFCVYVSGPLSSNLRATFGQLWTIGGSGDSKIRSGSPGVWPICDKILHVARPDPATFCIGSFWHIFHCRPPWTPKHRP